jgi:hypothetical protein
MNHAQKYLAQAIQRVIIKDALATGQRSAMAESLLDALEGSLRLFEKHRVSLVSCRVNHPSSGSIRGPRPATGTGRAGTWHNQARGA